MYTMIDGRVHIENYNNVVILSYETIGKYGSAERLLYNKLVNIVPEEDLLFITNSGGYGGECLYTNNNSENYKYLNYASSRRIRDMMGTKVRTCWVLKFKTEEQLILVKTILGL